MLCVKKLKDESKERSTNKVNEMNELEKALLDKTGAQLDFYLQDVSIADFRIHIKQMLKKEQVSSSASELKAKIQDVLNKVNE